MLEKKIYLKGLDRDQVREFFLAVCQQLKWDVLEERDDKVTVIAISSQLQQYVGPGFRVPDCRIRADFENSGVIRLKLKFEQFVLLSDKKLEEIHIFLRTEMQKQGATLTKEVLTSLVLKKQEQKRLQELDFQHRLKENTLNGEERVKHGIGGYVSTMILIGINVLVFGAMAIMSKSIDFISGDSALAFGGLNRKLVMHGEYQRILTNMFVHCSIMHLFNNMLVLAFLGKYLEPLLGRIRFLLCYLSLGVFAALVSLWWYPNKTVVAGASGAIFGLMGLFLSLLKIGIFEERTRKKLVKNLWILVLYGLFSGLQEGIANMAHLGGLVSGMVTGFVLRQFFFSMRKDNVIVTSLVPVMMSCLAAVFFLMGSKDYEDTKMATTFIRIRELDHLNRIDMEKVNDPNLRNQTPDLFRRDVFPRFKEIHTLLDEVDTYHLDDEKKSFLKYYKEYIKAEEHLDELFVRYFEGDKSITSQIGSEAAKFRVMGEKIMPYFQNGGIQ